MDSQADLSDPEAVLTLGCLLRFPAVAQEGRTICQLRAHYPAPIDNFVTQIVRATRAGGWTQHPCLSQTAAAGEEPFVGCSSRRAAPSAAGGKPSTAGKCDKLNFQLHHHQIIAIHACSCDMYRFESVQLYYVPPPCICSCTGRRARRCCAISAYDSTIMQIAVFATTLLYTALGLCEQVQEHIGLCNSRVQSPLPLRTRLPADAAYTCKADHACIQSVMLSMSLEMLALVP